MNDRSYSNVEIGYSMFDHVAFMDTLRSTKQNTYAINQKQAESLRQDRKHHKENVYLHNTAIQQNKRLYQLVERSFDTVAGKLDFLETSLGAQLYEVRWMLAHIEGSLNEFVELFKNKRETEAHELVKDGNKALSVNRLEDAEDCLIKAIELKRTDYKAHLTLGIAYREMGEKDKAIKEFVMSIDYAEDQNEKVFAMVNLANTYRFFEEYEKAIKALLTVIEFKQASGYSTTADLYQLAITKTLAGNETEAIDLLLDVFQIEPAYCQPALLDQNLQPVKDTLVKRVADHAKELEKTITEKLDRVKRNIPAIDSGPLQYALDDPKLGKQLSAWVDLAEQALKSKSYSSLLWANEFMFHVAGGVSILSDITRMNETIEEKTAQVNEQRENVDRWKRIWFRFPQLRFLPAIITVIISLIVLAKGFQKIPAHWQITSHKFLSVIFYYPVVIILTIAVSALLLWAAYRLFRYMDKRWMEKINEEPPLDESKNKFAQVEQELAQESQQLDFVRKSAQESFDEAENYAKKLRQDLSLEKTEIAAKRPEGSYILRDFLTNMMVDDPSPDDPWPLTPAKAKDFLQHFLDVPFSCDNPVRSIVIRGGKNNLPNHSLTNGLLYSQTLEEIRKIGEWPEPIGAIEFQYGGTMKKPVIKVISV